MRRRFNLTALSSAIVAVFMCGSVAMAQCDSGGCDAGGFAAYPSAGYNASYASGSGGVLGVSRGGGSCGAGGCGASRGGGAGSCGAGGCGFGYPGANCCNGGCGGGAGGGVAGGFGSRHGHGNGALRQHASHLAEIHKRDFARNQAWPKPFNCADRQLYFGFFNPMLDAGQRGNCLFTANHFDANSNDLNDSGRSKLAGIFKSAPVGQKIALVQNAGNSNVVDARLVSLRSTIDKWYGSNSFTQVDLATDFPTTFDGGRVERLSRLSRDTTPPPAIPVASGTGTTNDTGVGQ